MIIGICTLVIVTAVLIDFLEFHTRKNEKKQKRSFVETGTMFLFFFLFYFVIRFNFGIISYGGIVRIILVLVSLAVVVYGTFVNVWGRFYLGKNWANQIKIYKDHTLVTSGPYRIVRHPLYASLIWIFYACSVIYLNWAAFLLNSLIFVPMMYIRASQEEKLLEKEFKNYKDYRKEVGMFFPKVKRW
jgi:protein-S-isoprenylcysteine O-methyltransferase Ste14